MCGKTTGMWESRWSLQRSCSRLDMRADGPQAAAQIRSKSVDAAMMSVSRSL